MNAESVDVAGRAVDLDLIKAAHRGYLESVRTLVWVDRADVNAQRGEESGGSTPLVNASQNGHLEIVKFLIGHGADVNKPIKEGITALMVASQSGHSLVAQFLIEHGADVLKRSAVRGLTAIFLAAERGHIDVVNLLIAADAYVNVAREDNGDRPMIVAAKRGNVEILISLIAADAKINVHRTDHGATPLMAASMNGHLPAVRVLLTAEANPNAKSTVDGTTSAFMAAQNGHVEILRELIRWEADVNIATTDDDSSPLTQAVWKGHAECVKVLLANGADINHRMRDGATPLVVAAERGHDRIVCELLCLDEEIVGFALKDGYREEVKKYIAQRDHTEYKKDKFRSWGVLKRAMKDSRIGAGMLTLDKADVNCARHDNGNTALIAAAQAGHTKIVRLLLANHADVNARNTAGFTALYMASMQHRRPGSGGRGKIVNALINAGADENILHDYEHSSPRLSTDPLPKAGREAWERVRQHLMDKGSKAFHDPIDMHKQWDGLKGAVQGHRRFARLRMDAKAEWALLRKAVADPNIDKSELTHVSGKEAWKALQRKVMVKGAYTQQAHTVDERNEADKKALEDEQARHAPKHEWHILRNAVHEMHQRKHHEKEALRKAQYRYDLSKEVAKAGKARAEMNRNGSLKDVMQRAAKYKLPAFLWAKSRKRAEEGLGLGPEGEGEKEGAGVEEPAVVAAEDRENKEENEEGEKEQKQEQEKEKEAENNDSGQPKEEDGEHEEEDGEDDNIKIDWDSDHEKGEGGDKEEEDNGTGASPEAGEEEDKEDGGEKDEEDREPEAAQIEPTPPVEEKPSKKGGLFGRMFR